MLVIIFHTLLRLDLLILFLKSLLSVYKYLLPAYIHWHPFILQY
jgi:hypothetical protein